MFIYVYTLNFLTDKPTQFRQKERWTIHLYTLGLKAKQPEHHLEGNSSSKTSMTLGSIHVTFQRCILCIPWVVPPPFPEKNTIRIMKHF